jgi:hypothetical protein
MFQGDIRNNYGDVKSPPSPDLLADFIQLTLSTECKHAAS